MLNRILVALFVFGVVACSKDSGGGGQSAGGSGCDASKGTVVTQLSQPSQSLIPGEYHFETADYVHRLKGESVLVTESFSSSDNGQRVHSARIVCPGEGKLSKAVTDGGIATLENSTPSLVLINEKGELEVPESFLMLSFRVDMENTQARVSVEAPRASSLQKEGVAKDVFQKVPGLKIVPVKDGLVLSVKHDSETESHVFFRLVKGKPSIATPAATPGPVPQTKPEPKSFTKEQCLELKRFNLGRYSKDLVRFTDDCSSLYVIAGEPIVEITAMALTGGGDNRTCGPLTKARLVLGIRSGELELLRELQKLNSGIYMQVLPSQRGSAQVSYLKKAGGSRMSVPVLGVGDDPRDANRSVFTFNGSVSGLVEMDSAATCSYFAEIQNYKSQNKKLAEILVKEFAVEFGTPQ